MKKSYIFVALVVSGCLIYWKREPLLRSVPKLLICEDELEPADALIVLSGNSYDRGNQAAQLYQQGWAKTIICPGGNPAYELEIVGLHITEAEAAKMNLLRHGVPDSVIVPVRAGTSTQEEAELVARYLANKGYQKVILLTSLYHTRRAKNTFRKHFLPHNIQLIVRGTPSSRFDIWNWWKSEEGLIAIQNEYLKNIYYLFK
jgi:uncharacterized SAM-binding protein YcdF (DUF218 family)